MDVGKLGEDHLDEITNNALEAMTSVNAQYIHTRDRKKKFQDFKQKNPAKNLDGSTFHFQNGDVKLSYHTFKLCFLNFLLGKQPNGPGQYIFGTVTPKSTTCMFPIDYSAMNATDEDIETFR